MRHGRMLGLDGALPLGHDRRRGRRLMGDAYPEIREAQARVAETVRQEEERFAETLDLGMARIRRGSCDGAPGPTRRAGRCDGRFLFTLYDTHGFPSTWPQEVLAGRGLAGHRRRPSRRSTPRWRRSASAPAPGPRSAAGDSGEPSVAIYQRLSHRARQASVPRLRRRWPRPRAILALVADGQRRREARAGRDGRDHPRPHARLRGVGRPGGRHRLDGRPRGRRGRSRTRTTAAASSSCTAWR